MQMQCKVICRYTYICLSLMCYYTTVQKYSKEFQNHTKDIIVRPLNEVSVGCEIVVCFISFQCSTPSPLCQPSEHNMILQQEITPQLMDDGQRWIVSQPC